MQSKATVIGDDRVAGVAAALETNNDIGIFRQNIGVLPFPSSPQQAPTIAFT